MRNLLALVVFVLVVYALIDCIRTRPADVRGLPKPLWIVLIIVLPPLGAPAWLLAGRQRGPAARPARPGRPVAPDDDPEFLWRLEQDRLRQRGSGEPGSPSGTTGPTPA